MMLDDRGVRALGKVSEQRKLAELARAEVLCAPSLHGESFGMVLTEAFAAATPVVASDIPGYRDVVRDGLDGLLVPPGDALALAEALRRLALDRRRARAWRSPHASGPSASPGRTSPPRCSTATSRPAVSDHPQRGSGASPCGTASPPPTCSRASPPSAFRASSPPQGRSLTRALGHGDCARCGALPCSRPHSGDSRWRCSRSRTSALTGLRQACSPPEPGLVAAGLALMCASMFARAIAWHAILVAAPTWRRAKRRDAMQGTFIGVLMSATLPARLGEPSRALIVARRLGRARETLPVVLGTMVSQTLLNLLALAIPVGIVMFSSVSVLDGRHGALIAAALAPLAALLAVLLAPVLVPRAAASRSWRLLGRLQALMPRCRCCACATACACFATRARPRSRRPSSSAPGRFSGCPAGCC